MISQTLWVDRKFNFDFPITNFPVIYSRLEGTLFRLEKLLEEASEEICCMGEGTWSVKQHIGHLTDLEDLWWQRLEDFREEKPVLTAADMKNEKTENAGHNQKTVQELLHEFSIERRTILDLIYHFDAAMLERTALHPRLNTPMRVIDSLYFVAEHDDHHISLISMLLKVAG